MSTRPDATAESASPSPDNAWQPTAHPPASRGRRTPAILAVVVSVVLLLLLALYAVGYLLAGDRLPRNATVSGVPVGGLDRATAVATLTEAVAPRATRPIKLSVNEEADKVTPAEAGLTVDYAASVAQAGGGKSFDPRQIWRVLTGGGTTELVTRTNEAKLQEQVRELAERYDAKPRDASLAFDRDEIDSNKARNGVTVQQEEAAARLEAAFLGDAAPVDVPVDVVEPEITTAEMEQVVDEFARLAVSAPVPVKVGSEGRFVITPTMIGSSITFEEKDGTLVPRLDADKLQDLAHAEIDPVELNEPEDATVRLVDGKPKVVPAVNGTSITAKGLAEAVEPVLTKTGDARTATVELSGAPAKFSTADAEKLGVKQVTGEFTTYFPYAPYRNINIPLAARKINGTLLKPGEIFSLNKVVGERTKANGFDEGFIIQGGKFRKELGGGVSQSATTTYNAMFFAGLEDVEHRPHTLYINRYPAGREATVAWPNLDLKFANNTEYGVLVQATTTKAAPGKRGSITVRMWSTKTYDEVRSSEPQRSNFTTGRDLEDDSPECEPQVAVPGFDVSYQRLFYNDGQVVKRENFFWRYAPTDQVRCT